MYFKTFGGTYPNPFSAVFFFILVKRFREIEF